MGGGRDNVRISFGPVGLDVLGVIRFLWGGFSKIGPRVLLLTCLQSLLTQMLRYKSAFIHTKHSLLHSGWVSQRWCARRAVRVNASTRVCRPQIFVWAFAGERQPWALTDPVASVRANQRECRNGVAVLNLHQVPVVLWPLRWGVPAIAVGASSPSSVLSRYCGKVGVSLWSAK